MAGMVTNRFSTISIIDASCVDNSITAVISNDGTKVIDTSTDLKILANSQEVQDPNFSQTLVDTGSAVIIGNIDGAPGSNSFMIISPSNSDGRVVYC